jgi:hypothetical protein
MPLLPTEQMATAPESPPDAPSSDPITAKLDIMDYELKNLNDTVSASVSKCFTQNVNMIKNYLKVQADEFRVLKKEIVKQQKEVDIKRELFDEDVAKFKA